MDVLITHGPPFGILDRTAAGLPQGCLELAEVVALLAPAVHLFGHIHEGYGTLTRNKTTFVNAALLDRHALGAALHIRWVDGSWAEQWPIV